MQEFEEHVANRFRFAQDGSNELPSRTADAQNGSSRRMAGTFSVRLLAAHQHDQYTAVLSVHGEIDLGTAPALRAALLPVLEHRSGPVVVDLSEVPFMDSTGVHVLLDTLGRLKTQNRRLAVACPEDGQVHRLLALTGLLDAVTVYRSRSSAVSGGDDRLRLPPNRTSSPLLRRTQAPAP